VNPAKGILPFISLRRMRKSLIIILILTIFLDGIGGFLGNRQSACSDPIAALFSGMDSDDHSEQEGNDGGDSHELVEMPTEDDYCHRSLPDIKADPWIELDKENYCDLYISHYPWTPKEIHTPPPKA
jgi:hypothetical protein